MGGEKFSDTIKDVYHEAKEAVVGLPPMPEVQPECSGWTKLPRKPNAKGQIFYFVGGKDGTWYPEPKVKCWYHEDQIKIIDKKIAAVDQKILPYETEIDRIRQYLKSAKKTEDGEEMQEASLRARIDVMTEQLKNLKDKGLISTDVEYRRRMDQIRKLQAQLSTKTPSSESKLHIADWPVKPGGPKVPNQDLYVLISNHKTTIDRIRTIEREPLEVQRERNDAYLKHWARIHREKSK